MLFGGHCRNAAMRRRHTWLLHGGVQASRRSHLYFGPAVKDRPRRWLPHMPLRPSLSERRRVLPALSSAAAVIFVGAMIVVLLLNRFPAQAGWTGAVLGAVVLSGVTILAVYVFALRPIEADAAFEDPGRESSEQRLRAQGRVLRTQRLEGIGLLAVGIAHDLNNVLSSIAMAVDLLKQTSTRDNQQLLDGIRANTQRGSEMIARVLSFARGQEGRNV